MVASIIFILFPFAMIYAALSDVLTMTIANRVSLLLIGGFIVVAPFIGITWTDFMWHLAAFGLVLSITFALFALGTMGGGDAKLMASTSIWIGFNVHLLDYVLMFTIAGGALTLLLVLMRNSSMATYAGQWPALWRVIDEKDVPYGVALAFGGLMVFPDTVAMQWAIAQFL
ncbi:MAG: prepilin peptidase [Pseudomonadota bacterium]